MSTFLPSQWKQANLPPRRTCPPPPPASARKTVLDPLETSVDPQVQLKLKREQALRDYISSRMLSSQYATPADRYILDLKACSTRYALFQTDEGLAVHPMRCRKRACPICQGASRAKWRARLKAAAARMTAPKHIVLTLRSSDDPLRAQVTRLFSSFRRLRQRKDWSRRRPWGYYILEITHSPDTGRFHPHLHIIGNLPFLHKDVLREAWLSITGDSSLTHIGAINGNVAAELQKYLQKASSVWTAPIDPYELNAQLKGIRTVQAFGNLPKLPKPDPPCCIFLGSIRHLLRQACKGHPFAIAMVNWSIANAPHAILAELYELGPPSPPEDPNLD